MIMKRIKDISIAAIALVIILAGCKKYEQFPVDKVYMGYTMPDFPRSVFLSAPQRVGQKHPKLTLRRITGGTTLLWYPIPI